ncbi:MAG TPA: HD-GYP domain-containing protein [Acidimicrobiales bacterium]|nr:HD-GYP domain-containing protein [Acidimicrobiales bacterium]
MGGTARRSRVLSGGYAFLAAGLLAILFHHAATSGSWPRPFTVLLFASLLCAAENASLVLPSKVEISPSFMVIMACQAAYGTRAAVLSAALTGAFGGVAFRTLRRRRYRSTVANCSQMALSAAAAAAAAGAIGPPRGQLLVAHVVVAAVAYAAVNIGLVLPAVSIETGASPAQVWADMRPMLPNYLTFGLVGALIGQVYTWLGPAALALLVVPLAIARWSFSSFLEIHEAREATVAVFLRAIEAKDAYTHEHTKRVARYAGYIGEELGLDPLRQAHLRQAALMHDIGKLAVPRHLLNKPGRLTPEEFALVQRHAHVCIDILSQVDFLRPMTAAAAGHHSRYDGGGYGGESETDLEAFVVAVADAFDAMTSTRSYRKALPQAVAFEELRDKSGSQFHPECVEALINAIERRGEHYGAGFEQTSVEFEVTPPTAGVGSAGLGDLEDPAVVTEGSEPPGEAT